MAPQTHDIGQTTWFRLLIGTLWLLVLAFTAVGIYSINPAVVAEAVTSTYLLGTLLSGGVLLAVTYLIFRQYPIRTPSRETEPYSYSK